MTVKDVFVLAGFVGGSTVGGLVAALAGATYLAGSAAVAVAALLS